MDPISLLMIVGAGAAFYFLIIRPGKQRQAKQAQMLTALQPGAEVMTSAGIFGTIAVVTDEEISLEVSPGVFIRILPAAISRVISPITEETAENAVRDDAEPPVD
ncbi:MAG: preprotein translocase subunit YajC [Actinobacteria bacterium]|nr:preprotein translocase subunit YajC [Actinomycetota bacterium]